MENKIVNLQINDNLEETSKSVSSLKSQLRAAQNEVAELSNKFGATSKEAIEAAKRAGELKDKIGDAKALTEAFNPDAKFKAVSASLTGVAGGFSVLTGAMGAFGTNSKAVEEQLLKVQSAMAMASGLQAVGESVDSFKQLGAVIKNTSLVQGIYNFVQTGSIGLTKANTVATEAQVVATQASTAATAGASGGLKLFRLALIGTGIGALVVGVGLLIANFDKVKSAVLNVIPGLAKVGDFIGGIVNSITDFVGATSDASRALDKLKENAENTLKVNKKFMQEHGDQVDAYTKKKIDAKNAYAEAIKEDGADQVALAKRLNRELEAIEFSRGDEKRKIQKDANEKENAERKANNDKIKKQAEDDAKKYNEETLNGQQDLNKKYLDNEIQSKIDKQLLQEEQLSILEEGVNAEAEIEEKARLKKKQSDEEASKASIELQQARMAAIVGMSTSIADSLDVIDSNSNKKSKASIAIRKGLALTELAINTATSLGNAQKEATSEGAKMSALFPMVPGIGIAAKVVSYASTAAMIYGNIQKAKALLGGGGGDGASGGASAPAGGGGAPAAPQFNVVGASGANQIASVIGGQEAKPIQAYVVAGAVTTGQALNRNIIANASIG